MFSGTVTSSPTKRKLRSDFCQSPDISLLSPDSSYLLDYSNGAPCCCRRSPRLLTNGYYDVTQGSFTWDQDGNVSLVQGKTSVSYKENLVRIFRRRRRPHPLVRLLHDVKDNCQSWLDHGLFRGVFRIDQDHSQGRTTDPNCPPSPICSPAGPRWDQDHSQDPDLDWSQTSLDEPWLTRLNSSELDERSPFVYDPTEAPRPQDKPPMIQEQPCPVTCQSQETLSQSVCGLSEVPPSLSLYPPSCCGHPERDRGLTTKDLLLLAFTVFITAFISTALLSQGLVWSSAVASFSLVTLSMLMVVTKSGCLGDWRSTRTEDISSRNE